MNTKHSVSSKREVLRSTASVPSCLPFCGLGAEEALKQKASRFGVLALEKSPARAATQPRAATDR